MRHFLPTNIGIEKCGSFGHQRPSFCLIGSSCNPWLSFWLIGMRFHLIPAPVPTITSLLMALQPH
jgi:hypothetical protein